MKDSIKTTGWIDDTFTSSQILAIREAEYQKYIQVNRFKKSEAELAKDRYIEERKKNAGLMGNI